MEIIKIAVLGDSITEGLGSKKINYCESLKSSIEEQNKVCIEIKNFAHTGTTIRYANEIKEKVFLYKPDEVIIFYGIVDSMLRPNVNHKPNFYKYIPKRYKGNGMLNPRPFYSHQWYKRVLQKIDSWFRSHLGLILLKMQGAYTWVDINDFEKEYIDFILFIMNKLPQCNISLVSAFKIDEKYYPGTPQSTKKYNEVIHDIALKYGLNFIDAYNEFSQYPWDTIFGPDHFHPSPTGYEIIGNYFGKKVCENTVDK